MTAPLPAPGISPTAPPGTARATVQELDSVTIRFVGDSGDGMQLAGTQFTDTSALVEGTTYFYVVTSVGPGGESVASNEASALIPVSKPLPPSNLTSTPK